MRPSIVFILIFVSTFFIASPLRAQGPADMVYIQDGDGTTWNPYPGLGMDGVSGQSCVLPGSRQPSSTNAYEAASIPVTTLNPSDYDHEVSDTPVVSVRNGGEFYLSQIPTGKRSGVFQRANFNALWVPKSGGAGALGMTQLDLSATFAVPMLKPESPLVISPTFQAWFFDPKNKGILGKKTLYTTGVDFRWIKPLVKNKFTLDLGVAALYSGDFKLSDGDTMRYPAHAAGIWECNPRLKVILGVVYLDRQDDYNWLPMAGLIWTPHDDVSVELILPRLRIAQRVRWFGNAAGDAQSDWVYGAFELGGGSWGHEYGGVTGHLDYRDLRFLIGYERRMACGLTLGLEVGYMFERKLEFDSLNYEASPADTVFLRLRTSY